MAKPCLDVTFFKQQGKAIGLLFLSVIFFVLSHPGRLWPFGVFSTGFPVLAYISLVPLFLLVRYVSWRSLWLYGFLYGTGVYVFFVSWLSSFHPVSIFFVAFFYGIFSLFLFFFFKFVLFLFPSYGWLVQALIWVAFDYLKTVGFLGFPYGILAYTQWSVPVIIQTADIFGIWGIDFFIAYTSALLSCLISVTFVGNSSWNKVGNIGQRLIKAVYKYKFCILFWLFYFIFFYGYGLLSVKKYADFQNAPTTEKKTVALIQHNADPWIGGIEAFQKNLDTLTALTDKALKNPAVDFVVWPETAFVPRIMWHFNYRSDEARFNLVTELLDYMDSKTVPFIIGNDHGEFGYNQKNKSQILDYNSALLFIPKENTYPPDPKIYRKVKLVPFTEYFPYEKTFPWLYQILIEADTHFWEPGDDFNVFMLDDFMVGTPICFEDTFGFVSRNLVKNGAQALVNLSNDAWSHSLAAQYQHMSMAVFRSVENRVPSVRSTTSGQTCVIDCKGSIVSMTEPFQENYLVEQIPVVDKNYKTIYTRFGDYLGVLFVLISIATFLGGCVRKIVVLHNTKRGF